MSEHLSDGELAALRSGGLPADRLLAVDDHLAGCPECRGRVSAPLGAAIEALRDGVLDPASHLTDEEVQSRADGTLDAAARARVDAHLLACTVCADQVRDLRAFVPVRRPLPRAYLAAAAAVLLAVVGPAISWQLTRRGAGPEGLPGFRVLTQDQQSQVRAALAAGVADPPPWLDALAGRTEVLMGPDAPPAPFRLKAPVATAVRDDRPRLEWQPLAGARAYEVAIADERLQTVAASAEINATSWSPVEPLPRGHTYAWQVTAHRGADSVTVPVAPAPPARFLVLDAETVARLESLERAHASSHLLLGIVLLEAGARDDARRHLEAVPATDPHAAVARRTLDRLQR